MTSPLEAIVVRFGAEWTGGAVINRIASDLNRIVASGKATGDALGYVSKMGGGQDAMWSRAAASVLKYQHEIAVAENNIRALGAKMMDITDAKGNIAKGMSLDTAAQEYKQYAAQIQASQANLNNAIPVTKSLGAAIAGMVPAIVASGAALAALGKGFQAWASAARQGAEVRQLAESFNYLTQNIYKVPELMQQMREASKGTISDFQLMSSYLTLTAGTSEELGRELSDNAPQLLEIAKAANILNPALGDTTFFFESLARGIKRSEIRLIDNLGLIIKVGEAQRRYADSIGVSVRSLTAEQKQLAILNEVLRVGGNLIDQVGGKTDSLVDPYLQWSASVENLKNNLSALASITFAPLIQAGADGVATWAAFAEAISQVAEGYAGIASIELPIVRKDTFFDAIGNFASPTFLGSFTKIFDVIGMLTDGAAQVTDLINSTKYSGLGGFEEWFNKTFEMNALKFFDPQEYERRIEYAKTQAELIAQLFTPGTEGRRDYWGDIDQETQALSEWTDEAKAAAIAQAELQNFNITGVEGANSLGIELIARNHINNIIQESIAKRREEVAAIVEGRHQMRAAMIEAQQNLAAASAAVSASRVADMTAGWLAAFAGGDFKSDLVIGDIRNIGTAWVTTSNATAEQTEKLGELNSELDRSREKLWDLQHGIGVQGDDADKTAKKIGELSAEISNYERVISELESGITYTTSQRTTGLNLHDINIFKELVGSFGDAGFGPAFLSDLAEGLGLVTEAGGEAMLKMGLLSGIMENFPLMVRGGLIDPSEIPAAIQEVIALFESEKTVAEIEIEIQAKVNTAKAQQELQRTWGPWIPREERALPDAEIGIGADLSAGERALQFLLGDVAASEAAFNITANADEAIATGVNAAAEIEALNPVLTIRGEYIAPDNLPQPGGSGGGGGGPEPFALGGYIFGSRGREVAIRAHAGEFVLRPEAVDRLGVGFLNMLNNGGVGSSSNNVSVQNNFYGRVDSEQARTVIVQSGRSVANELEEVLLKSGYRL